MPKGAAPVIAAIVVAAGRGERFGAPVPKQFLPLLGKSVLQHSLDLLASHPRLSYVLPVLHPDHINASSLPAIAGGLTRAESVLRGLRHLSLQPDKPDYVLIHDGARPCLTTDLVDRVIDALYNHPCVVPAIALTDTLRRDSSTVERRDLYAIQTPQGFHFDKILALAEKNAVANQELTDDAGLFEAIGISPHRVAGERDNLKITHPDDLRHAEMYLSSRTGDVRCASGYDVHRLIPKDKDNRKLMIGGVAIAHDYVLEGHSDADVALHALTDALLGTVGAGDIGQHFSPKDPRWKNADSLDFLRHAASLVTSRGGLVAHADVTIICEEPKISPHRDAMRKIIADNLFVDIARVSVKATTTEGLGFTGRREGIAAHATATVRLPFSATMPLKDGAP